MEQTRDVGRCSCLPDASRNGPTARRRRARSPWPGVTGDERKDRRIMVKPLCTLLAAVALMGAALSTGRPAVPAHASGGLASPVWPNTALQHVVIHNLYMDNTWDAHNP